MKILIVANYKKDEGGISGVVINHYNGLKNEGFPVRIFNTKKNSIIRIVLLLKLVFIVKKYDVIHIHCCSGLGFYPAVIGILGAKIFNSKKTVLTYHGGAAEQFLSQYPKFIKYFISKADEITVMSEFLHKTFFKFGINTVILKNVINKAIEYRKVDFQSVKLVSIRSLSSNYNIHDICESFKLIKKEYPKATLQIVGGGELENRIRESYEEIAGISFIGRVSNNEIMKILKNNNIFISVPTFDNQPMSILEAFASGLIVISTNVGGIPFMIEKQINGLLVDVNKPEEIKNKVVWIMENKQKANIIIENGYNEVKKYNWSNIGPKLLKLYQNQSFNFNT